MVRFSFLFLSFLCLMLIGESFGVGEAMVGIEGLRCDSCGQECSTVCGSRQFRTCCFNYIKKKRSGGGGPPVPLLPVNEERDWDYEPLPFQQQQQQQQPMSIQLPIRPCYVPEGHGSGGGGIGNGNIRPRSRRALALRG